MEIDLNPYLCINYSKIRTNGNRVEKSILIILGLGNKGDRFRHTRHNVGFRFIDRIAERLAVTLKKPLFRKFLMARGFYHDRELFLAKPLTYMNRSGEILGGLLRYAKGDLRDLVVVCDTLDLPPGSCRLKTRGSSAGHRGLESIIRSSGSHEFLRLYIGIGRPASKSEVIDHVLGEFSPVEQSLIDRSFQKAERGVLDLLLNPPERVMNNLNER